MPGFFTDYTNNKVLDSILGNTPFTAPSTLYFGLSQNTSNKAGTLGEPSSGGYARVAVSNNLSAFASASNGTKTNSSVIGFPAPTGNWGTVSSVFISDSPSGGNVLAMADLASPRTISAGNAAPSIAIGALYLSHT